ncbi:polysaccharide deacetylase family protein [Nocardia cyriacigeorgica]|nr:polysaccharide deacetylase family protein [Nocardia cyriacigeorgica]MBF6457013.1 polysaccharide deacetylase family protein [Nocardia cyriacigeorgica]MBF6554326.1 polysaccharide deacetylase family protein [Nocardia cyriacigeorgica]
MVRVQRRFSAGAAGFTFERRRFLALGALAPIAAGVARAEAQPLSDAGTAHAFDPHRFAGRAPQQWGTHLHGIHTHVATVPGRRTLALTFDGCGGPSGSAVDHRLLDTLREFGIAATLFLNHRWLTANPAVAADLAADPLFRLENHGTSHMPLSVNGTAAYGIPGTTDPADVVNEIETNRRYLRDTLGATSTWFRAGTAHYDDVAVEIAGLLGVRLAGFAVNADYGATASPDTVATHIRHAPDGAIILAHLNHPASGTAAGLRAALMTLRAEGVNFTHLAM